MDNYNEMKFCGKRSYLPDTVSILNGLDVCSYIGINCKLLWAYLQNKYKNFIPGMAGGSSSYKEIMIFKGISGCLETEYSIYLL